jgi:hypothetical protein
MMKRRLKDFGLPLLYSPRSFRVTIITDLLEQNVPREDVRHMAGHADAAPPASTTGTRSMRDIEERISV